MAGLLPLVGFVLLAGCGDEGRGRAFSEEAGAAPLASADADDSTRHADSLARARQDSLNRAQPGYVIDSVLPVEEEIRRFQAALPRIPVHLEDGAASLDELVRRVADAVSRNDTTALVRLMVTRSEFGYLVYPSSPHTHEPYRLAPDIVWLQVRAASNKGADRLLSRLGGQPMVLASHSCSGQPDRQGENVIRTGCAVRLADSPEVPRKLFGPVIERQGRFKLLSLANDL